MVCTFFGYSDCYGPDEKVLKSAIEELIYKGAHKFANFAKKMGLLGVDLGSEKIFSPALDNTM